MGFDISKEVGEKWMEFDINYDDTSPVTLINAWKGLAVLDARVLIVTAFAGTSPTIDIGDADNPDGFIPNASITETSTGLQPLDQDALGDDLFDGTNDHEIIKYYTGAKAIRATIGGTSLTAGKAKVFIKIKNFPGE